MWMAMTSTTLTAQRFDVDPAIKDLDKRLKARERTFPEHLARVMAVAVVAVAAVILGILSIIFPLESFDANLGRGALALVALGILGGCWLGVARTVVSDTTLKVNKERRASQRSIKRSIKSARTLGDAVPVVTVYHAEAGIRFDKAVDDHGTKWTRENLHGIRSLLLEDLSREDAIINLVTERGMVTLSEVREALHEMESNGKPLQGGWL
jgi:hypothetical protein